MGHTRRKRGLKSAQHDSRSCRHDLARCADLLTEATGVWRAAAHGGALDLATAGAGVLAQVLGADLARKQGDFERSAALCTTARPAAFLLKPGH